MTFESLLAIDSLLAMIVGLLGILNFNQSKIKGYLSSINNYFKKDILIRNRLERKSDFLLDKMSVDLSQFENTAMDLKELEKYD